MTLRLRKLPKLRLKQLPKRDILEVTPEMHHGFLVCPSNEAIAEKLRGYTHVLLPVSIYDNYISWGTFSNRICYPSYAPDLTKELHHQNYI